MDADTLARLKELKGVVATVCITGSVDEHFAEHLSHMRSFCDRNGWHNVEWRTFPAQFVETGRDEVIAHALREGYEWVLQIDADAAPFSDQALQRMLVNAYVLRPDTAVMGAYCQLKAPPYLPTIDTGTGRWEEHYPGEGIIPVIRTGGHFHLVKVPPLARLGPPWYRARMPLTPARAMAELDNFARTRLDGRNPLADHPEWVTLMTEARAVSAPHMNFTSVGEDSAFCDMIRAAGGMIYVDTDFVVGHVSKKAVGPEDLRKEMHDRDRLARYACGVFQ